MVMDIEGERCWMEMNTKRITWIFTVLFFAAMFFLALVARRIHIASLPKVTVCSLEMVQFEEKQGEESEEKNSSVEFSLGLPKELYHGQKIFVISMEVVNGEERSIAREVYHLVLGRENKDCYEVVEGITSLDRVILSEEESIQNGDEVYIEQ